MSTRSSSTIHIETFDNGLTVILEPMPHYESVSIEIHTPGGLIADEDKTVGTSLLFPELTERGAGSYDSRGLSDAFDALGARHGTSTSTDRFLYRATVLKDVLEKTLELLSLKVLAPTFPKDEVQPIKELLAMDARSLLDSPAKRTSLDLHKRFLPHPYNRSSYVENPDSMDELTKESVEELYAKWVRPERSIISLAGNFEIKDAVSAIKKYFGMWKGTPPPIPTFTGINPPVRHHIQHEAAQVQICLAYPSAKFSDELYYAAKVANEVLSGGMFGRLFIEVREKRGLCYSVYSRHSGGRFVGSVTGYSGTTPERAKETLAVMLDVIRGISGTVTAEELQRAKANLKSGLIIGEESAASRAGSNAGDYWISGRIRPLPEISQAIDKITPEDIDRSVSEFPPDKYSLVTLGSVDITK